MQPTRETEKTLRGECRECGRVMTLKVDGTVRHHKPYLGGVPWEDYCCDGSGTLPVAAGVSREATPVTAPSSSLGPATPQEAIADAIVAAFDGPDDVAIVVSAHAIAEVAWKAARAQQ